jgi:hypothetical protein
VSLPPSISSASILAGLPAALAGLGGAPWWAVGVILLLAYLVVPMTAMVLDHVRQRKGDAVDEKFAATLEEIDDPEKRIQAIINYRQATGATSPPPPPPDPPPGSLPTGTSPSSTEGNS